MALHGGHISNWIALLLFNFLNASSLSGSVTTMELTVLELKLIAVEIRK